MLIERSNRERLMASAGLDAYLVTENGAEALARSEIGADGVADARRSIERA